MRGKREEDCYSLYSQLTGVPGALLEENARSFT
jgi:hypothetical protein